MLKIVRDGAVTEDSRRRINAQASVLPQLQHENNFSVLFGQIRGRDL